MNRNEYELQHISAMLQSGVKNKEMYNHLKKRREELLNQIRSKEKW